MTDKMWTGYPDPRELGPYDSRYQCRQYDDALREWGEAHYSGEDTGVAWYRVMILMQVIDKEKHREFVLRSVC